MTDNNTGHDWNTRQVVENPGFMALTVEAVHDHQDRRPLGIIINQVSSQDPETRDFIVIDRKAIPALIKALRAAAKPRKD